MVGYVGPVSDYDLSRINDPDPVLQIPRFQIGKTGVEAKTEGALRGKAGNKYEEQNAYGRIMRELRRTPGTKGADLQLTIDEGLQNFHPETAGSGKRLGGGAGPGRGGSAGPLPRPRPLTPTSLCAASRSPITGP